MQTTHTLHQQLFVNGATVGEIKQFSYLSLALAKEALSAKIHAISHLGWECELSESDPNIAICFLPEAEFEKNRMLYGKGEVLTGFASQLIWVTRDQL